MASVQKWRGRKAGLSGCLHRLSFDHIDRASGRDDRGHLKPRYGEKIAESRASPDATVSGSQYAEHEQVSGHGVPESEALAWLIAGRHDPFDQQDFAVIGNRFAAVP